MVAVIKAAARAVVLVGKASSPPSILSCHGAHSLRGFVQYPQCESARARVWLMCPCTWVCCCLVFSVSFGGLLVTESECSLFPPNNIYY